MIDNSHKGITELDIVQKCGVATPNSTVDIATVFSRSSDTLSSSLVKEARLKLSQNLSNMVASVFYNVSQQKREMRTDIAKEFSNYMSKVTRHHSVKNECVQRLMRSYKVKQLIRYCETISLKVYLDAQKVQAVQVS